MPRKIMIINPWGADYMDRAAVDVVSPYVHAHTEVACVSLGAEASPLPWPLPQSAEIAVRKARQAEADGFDAIVVGCCADPFLPQLRQAVTVPVVGLTESFCMTARSRGKVTVMVRGLADSYRRLIVTQDNWKANWTDRVASHGLGRDDFTVRRVFVPQHPDPETLEDLTARDQPRLRQLTIAAMRESLHEQGLEQTRAAAREDGARAVFFACAFWSLPIHELGNTAYETFGTRVVNPLVCGVTYAEQLLVSGGTARR
ncbi:MAG: aspartate/glutamate racemase family protein [Rubrivivax sp.]